MGGGSSPEHSPASRAAKHQVTAVVRYRAKLVALRTGLKSQFHAVLAKHGVQETMTDLFGVGGRQLMAHLLETDPWFGSPFGQRIESLLVLIGAFEHEIDELTATMAHVFRPQPCNLPSWSRAESTVG